MDTQHTAFNGGPPTKRYSHQHKQSFSVSLISCLLLAGFCLQASAQTFEPVDKDRIIFEPQIITITPSEAYKNYEEYRESIGDNPVLDEAGIISTPERAVYVNQIERYEDQVNQLIIDEGIYSEGLISNYLAMAEIFENNKQQDLAFEAYDSALQVIRIEHGLYTGMQLPVLKALADVHMKKGDIAAAREKLNKIHDLQKMLSDDSIESSALINLDYAMNLYALAEYAYYHKSADPHIIVSSMLTAKLEFNKAAKLLSFDERVNKDFQNSLHAQIIRTNFFIEKIIIEKELRILDSIGMLFLANGTSKLYMRNNILPSYNDQLSADLLNAASSYDEQIFGSDIESVDTVDIYPPYIESIRLLYSELNYKIQSSAPTESVFTSMINIADWSLILGLSYTKEARQVYDEAYVLLQESELENKETLINENFNQEIPTQIPTYIPADYSLEGYGASDSDSRTTLGFVDVSFRTDRNGHAKRVKVLFKSPELDQKYEEMLVEDLQRNQYRPAFEGSKPVRKDYSLRYYVSELN